MNNNIFSDAMWWLRSRDKGALIFVGILAALLLVLLIYAFARGNSTSDDSSDFVVSESPTTVATAAAVATVAPQPTVAIPTAIPTAAPTPALTTDDLVAGADNADQVATDDAGAAAGEATTEPEPTNTPVPAAAASPTNTPVPASDPAPAPTAEPTPTATATPTGPPEPSPTPCIIGSGGFCIRPGEAPPATQATATPTSAPATPTSTPTAAELPSGSITQDCGDDGSITITFSATNPETATAAISVQPIISGHPSPAAFVVPANDTLAATVTLAVGYLVGEASLFVDQSPVTSLQLNDCTPALVG